jgi:hypothetical protein
MPMESLPLRDIHLPLPIGIWPLAPGWWCLIAALIAATAVILFLIQRYRRPTALKQALEEVDRLFEISEISHVQRNQEISLILKKLAVTTYPREDVAGLAGEEWIDWVKSRADGTSYSPQILSFLRYGPYCINADIIENKERFQSELHQLLTSVASIKKPRIFIKRIRQSKKAKLV